MKSRPTFYLSRILKLIHKQSLVLSLAGICASGFGHQSVIATEENQQSDSPLPETTLPRLPEILQVIREHLPSISEEGLHRAALQGILTEFQSQLELVSSAAVANERAFDGAPALTRYYESSIGYIAAPLFDATAATNLKEAYNRLDSEHILHGLIIDLRHVSGNDYEQVSKITGLFTENTTPLFDWGQGIRSSEPQAIQIKVPLVIAIDQTTRGAAEVLAAVIRSANLGILVGQTSAGQAHADKLIPLETGHQLRVPDGTVRLADGTELTSQGVEPDIVVTVSPESDFIAGSSSAETSPTEPNSPLSGDLPLPTPTDDPVLARVIELLKGIGIVERRNRS
ncbi:MAG: Carboxy-terminal processing protease CtpB [Verrucomicrobia subdivision 3 bacterium]|nr:Carboxy-terminal processing protease CtpB [Limisphaerales bacterium]MCS1414497.1 Carboxy-terminal processing protease CtpB [Limisphaerales bacterium]